MLLHVVVVGRPAVVVVVVPGCMPVVDYRTVHCNTPVVGFVSSAVVYAAVVVVAAAEGMLGTVAVGLVPAKSSKVFNQHQNIRPIINKYKHIAVCVLQFYQDYEENAY